MAIDYLVQRGPADAATGSDTWLDTPPAGVHLPMPEGTGPLGEEVIVLKKHETRQGLVLTTVLADQ